MSIVPPFFHKPIFSLRPMNERAREVIAHDSNSEHVSELFDGSPALNVRFRLSSSSYTLAVIGRGRDANIIVDVSNISRVQCSFEVIREINGIMLYDRSNGNTTHVFGANATPFEDGRPRKVVVQKRLNTKLGIGGRGDGDFQFEIVWHFSQAEVSERIQRWFAWYDSLGYQEDPWLSRTTDDLEAALTLHGCSGVILSDQNCLDGVTDIPLEMHKKDRSNVSCESSENATLSGERVKSRANRDLSRPYYQFDAQVSDEKARLIEGIRDQTQLVSHGTELEELAHDIVKGDWMDQGIWCEEWNEVPQWNWKHEESYREPSPSACEEKATPPTVPFFSIFSTPNQAQLIDDGGNGYKSIQDPSTPKTGQTVDAEASRPLHQFEYQILIERNWIKGQAPMENLLASGDINTRAYENVKAAWQRRCIWNEEWGILPGMAWNHELPIHVPDDPVPQTTQEQPSADLSSTVTGLGFDAHHSHSNSFSTHGTVALEGCIPSVEEKRLRSAFQERWKSRKERAKSSSRTQGRGKLSRSTGLFMTRPLRHPRRSSARKAGT